MYNFIVDPHRLNKTNNNQSLLAAICGLKGDNFLLKIIANQEVLLSHVPKDGTNFTRNESQACYPLFHFDKGVDSI